MRNLSAVQVGWNWIKESGGAAQSVLDFSKALDSMVISFTNEHGCHFFENDSRRQLHIPYRENFLNKFSYTNSPIKRQAENILFGTDLILIHGFYRYHFDWAVSIANRYSIPFWILPHGSLDPYVFTYRGLAKKLWLLFKGNKSFANAKHVIFATESEKDKSYVQVSPEKSIVIHWPVDPVNTHGSAEVKLRVRMEHDIPHDAKVLLFIGRFHFMKRPMETIKCVASCNLDDVYLMMMGPDSDVLTAVDCNDYCKKIGYTNVRFINPVFSLKKYDYFIAANAFISLSYRENFGYTVAESLLSGIPVILSPGNDLSKDIRHLNCGWFLTDDNLESASRAVNDFAATPGEQLVEMGRRGQEWAQTELSPEMFKSQMQALALETVKKAKQTP